MAYSALARISHLHGIDTSLGFELPHVVGQVVNLLADCQSARRRYTTAAQDSILPHIETAEAKVNSIEASHCGVPPPAP